MIKKSAVGTSKKKTPVNGELDRKSAGKKK